MNHKISDKNENGIFHLSLSQLSDSEKKFNKTKYQLLMLLKLTKLNLIVDSTVMTFDHSMMYDDELVFDMNFGIISTYQISNIKLKLKEIFF